jgi:hypothetical protein
MDSHRVKAAAFAALQLAAEAWDEVPSTGCVWRIFEPRPVVIKPHVLKPASIR